MKQNEIIIAINGGIISTSYVVFPEIVWDDLRHCLGFVCFFFFQEAERNETIV